MFVVTSKSFLGAGGGGYDCEIPSNNLLQSVVVLLEEALPQKMLDFSVSVMSSALCFYASHPWFYQSSLDLSPISPCGSTVSTSLLDVQGKSHVINHTRDYLEYTGQYLIWGICI